VEGPSKESNAIFIPRKRIPTKYKIKSRQIISIYGEVKSTKKKGKIARYHTWKTKRKEEGIQKTKILGKKKTGGTRKICPRKKLRRVAGKGP